MKLAIHSNDGDLAPIATDISVGDIAGGKPGGQVAAGSFAKGGIVKVLWTALVLGLCTTLFSVNTVSAQDWDSDDTSGSAYDWRSGNTYNWDREYDGSTTVDGYNLRTGSTWRTEIEPDGDMSGLDSKGNLWQYDASTGFYSNTDGTICTGKGVLRTCN